MDEEINKKNIENLFKEVKDLKSSSENISLREDFDNLRIIKEAGFRGVTLPIIFRVPSTDAQTAANYTTPYFIANRNYVILEVQERHEVAGSDGSAVTLQIEKLADGTAPGAGVSVLTAGLDLKATADTIQDGVVVKTAGRYIERGDALTLETTGVLTALTGVTVYILLKAV